MLDAPEWTLRLSPQTPHALSKVRQLYLSLYEAITRGDLPFEQKLPPSRQLSKQLCVARNTVIAVYAQLDDEGLIKSDGRRGTTVVHRVSKVALSTVKTEQSQRLSSRSSITVARSGKYAALAPGMPDPDLFPKTNWRKALTKASRLSADDLGYKGYPLPELQNAIARFLAIYRSLHVDPDRIVITSSTRQSLLLAATMYSDPGQEAWIESPGYRGAVDAFSVQGLRLYPMPIDEHGVIVDALPMKRTPAIIYVTPCFQYPTGAPMDANRRQQMLDFASSSGAVLFEDDYDSEFRDDSQARPALASQETASATVLHAGTFSKLIFPAARIAWLVVPPEHIEKSYACLRMLGGGHNTVAQATVAELLGNGTVARHLQRARGIYTQRRQALVAELDKSEMFHTLPYTGGSLSLVARMRDSIAREKLTNQLFKHKIGAQIFDELIWDKTVPDHIDALILGLGNVDTLQIPRVVGDLLNALHHAKN